LKSILAVVRQNHFSDFGGLGAREISSLLFDQKFGNLDFIKRLQTIAEWK